jgi:biotin operon repressor
MRNSTVKQMNKVHSILTDKEYVKAEELMRRTNLSKASIYRVIKLIEQELNVPIYSTKKGYILAQYAKACDDVLFLRKANGTYSRNAFKARLVLPYVGKRWKTEKEKDLLDRMIMPMLPSDTLLKKAELAFVTTLNSLGL